MAQIPVIDLSPYFSGQDKMAAAQQIKQACEEIGFFTIRGHGIPLETIQAANAAARTFFDQSLTEKRLVESPGGMGYIGPQGENLAASLDDDAVLM